MMLQRLLNNLGFHRSNHRYNRFNLSSFRNLIQQREHTETLKNLAQSLAKV